MVSGQGKEVARGNLRGLHNLDHDPRGRIREGRFWIKVVIGIGGIVPVLGRESSRLFNLEFNNS